MFTILFATVTLFLLSLSCKPEVIRSSSKTRSISDAKLDQQASYARYKLLKAVQREIPCHSIKPHHFVYGRADAMIHGGSRTSIVGYRNRDYLIGQKSPEFQNHPAGHKFYLIPESDLKEDGSVGDKVERWVIYTSQVKTVTLNHTSRGSRGKRTVTDNKSISQADLIRLKNMKYHPATDDKLFASYRDVYDPTPFRKTVVIRDRKTKLVLGQEMCTLFRVKPVYELAKVCPAISVKSTNYLERTLAPYLKARDFATPACLARDLLRLAVDSGRVETVDIMENNIMMAGKSLPIVGSAFSAYDCLRKPSPLCWLEVGVGLAGDAGSLVAAYGVATKSMKALNSAKTLKGVSIGGQSALAINDFRNGDVFSALMRTIAIGGDIIEYRVVNNVLTSRVTAVTASAADFAPEAQAARSLPKGDHIIISDAHLMSDVSSANNKLFEKTINQLAADDTIGAVSINGDLVDWTLLEDINTIAQRADRLADEYLRVEKLINGKRVAAGKKPVHVNINFGDHEAPRAYVSSQGDILDTLLFRADDSRVLENPQLFDIDGAYAKVKNLEYPNGDPILNTGFFDHVESRINKAGLTHIRVVGRDPRAETAAFKATSDTPPVTLSHTQYEDSAILSRQAEASGVRNDSVNYLPTVGAENPNPKVALPENTIRIFSDSHFPAFDPQQKIVNTGTMSATHAKSPNVKHTFVRIKAKTGTVKFHYFDEQTQSIKTGLRN